MKSKVSQGMTKSITLQGGIARPAKKIVLEEVDLLCVVPYPLTLKTGHLNPSLKVV